MKKTSITQQTLRFFWQSSWHYKHLLIPLLISVALAVITLSFITPYLAAQVLGKVSERAYDPSNLWGSFGENLLLYAIATVLGGVVLWRLNIWLIWDLELKAVRDIAQKIFRHLMMMSPSFHANRFGGSLVSQANKLTGAYVRFVDTTIFNIFTLTIAMISTIVILAPRALLYTVVLTILSIVYVLVTIYYSKPVRDANTVEAEAQSAQTGALSDSIANVLAVKSFAREDFENERYQQVSTEVLNKGVISRLTTTKRETYASLLTSTLGVSSLLIAILGVYWFNADIVTLFLIVNYTGGVGERLWEFQNALRNYNRALGDASDMIKILQIEPGIKDPVNPLKPKITKGTIEFTKMSFTHAENNEPLFDNLNLIVNAGTRVGLVGHSGSGKTTLTKLLLRFADIDGGSITIDGQDISSITQADLHRFISYVPQEPLLFHRSLAENIAYGKPDATQKEIEAVSVLAHAHEFIEKLPNGYDTLVGERGVKLSGGQRQRVAIARAMLKDAPILLLDEATSALDSESEKLIQDALWKLMEGRTAVVIAHRLSTVQKMDRIVVLDNGKIIEQGNHQDLLKQKGKYFELWTHQSGGFLEE